MTLEDFRGRWVVLYFFPKDDSPGCTRQAIDFTRHLPEFERLDAVVVGVSPDSPVEHRFFREKHGLEIILLSDSDREVLRAYGALREFEWRDRVIGRVVRSTVLIAPDGHIAWHWPDVVATGHAERVKERLNLLRGASIMPRSVRIVR